MIPELLRAQYSALSAAFGYADLSGRSQVAILGKDRAQLLHGLCTNDIKALKPGDGCEAFLTNVQGKTIGYVYVFCDPDAMILESVPGAAPEIIRNLGRFVIREDARFVDYTADWGEVLVCGPQAADNLSQLLLVQPPAAPLQHVTVDWRGGKVRWRRVPFAGAESFFVATNQFLTAEFCQELAVCGGVCGDATVVDILRIEAGSPLFGQDVTEQNLPQEVNRTPQAISFKKGCYLGQETVARLDALGHVNRTLCGVRFLGKEIPPVGGEIQVAEKLVGRITAACWSLRLDAPLALAYVRSGHHQVGDRFPSPWGDAEIVRLPLE